MRTGEQASQAPLTPDSSPAPRDIRRRIAEPGFTVIELLVSMAIVSVLAATAIISYVTYRTTSYDTIAKEDLRNAVAAQEALFTDADHYAECADTAACMAGIPSLNVTRDVKIQFALTSPTDYIGTATHLHGKTVWEFNSMVGRFVERQ